MSEINLRIAMQHPLPNRVRLLILGQADSVLSRVAQAQCFAAAPSTIMRRAQMPLKLFDQPVGLRNICAMPRERP